MATVSTHDKKVVYHKNPDIKHEVIETDPAPVLLALLCTNIEEVLSLPIDDETKDRLSELVDCIRGCRNRD